MNRSGPRRVPPTVLEKMLGKLRLSGRFALVALAATVAALLFLTARHFPDFDVPESIRKPISAFASSSSTSSSSSLPKQLGANAPSLRPDALVAAASIAAAGNATLGFHKILWINVRRRWDKGDARSLQTYVSGLNIETVAAVEGKADIDDAGRVGLPPVNGRTLNGGEIACYRSHANVSANTRHEVSAR
jgi:hypothetical protein